MISITWHTGIIRCYDLDHMVLLRYYDLGHLVYYDSMTSITWYILDVMTSESVYINMLLYSIVQFTWIGHWALPWMPVIVPPHHLPYL